MVKRWAEVCYANLCGVMSKLWFPVHELLELRYDEKDIIKALKDVQIRLSWKINSFCSIYSRKHNTWYDGEIIDVFINKQTKERWLMIKYNVKNTKKIQRFNSNIRSINSNYHCGNIQIIKYIANKLKTNNYIIKIPEDNNKNKKKKKKKKMKKQKKYYSGLGLDDHSMPDNKYWKTINIDMVILVLYGYSHQIEEKYNIFIPNELTEIIIKYFYYNKYVEITYQKYNDSIGKDLGNIIFERSQIAKHSLFKFYASKCPNCKKTKKRNNEILEWSWSIRGKYSKSDNYENNANVYQCKNCRFYIVVNVKNQQFSYNLKIRNFNEKYNVLVTPFDGNKLYMFDDVLSSYKLMQKYPKKGKCDECNFDTIQLHETRNHCDNFIDEQTRYCVCCGLFYFEKREKVLFHGMPPMGMHPMGMMGGMPPNMMGMGMPPMGMMGMGPPMGMDMGPPMGMPPMGMMGGMAPNMMMGGPPMGMMGMGPPPDMMGMPPMGMMGGMPPPNPMMMGGMPPNPMMGPPPNIVYGGMGGMPPSPPPPSPPPPPMGMMGPPPNGMMGGGPPPNSFR